LCDKIPFYLLLENSERLRIFESNNNNTNTQQQQQQQQQQSLGSDEK